MSEQVSLKDFVAGLAALPEDRRAPALWEDQQRRWQRGEWVRVEAYLEALPAPVPEELVLDLVYGEVMLREEGGEAPTADEYAARFPACAAPIRRQLDLHGHLSGREDSVSVGDTVAPAPAVEEPPVPSEIAGYRVVAPLQSGGQGVVYRGVHPALGRDVVIKVGHEAAGAAGNALVAEGRILAELDHPGLARVYDLRLHEGRPCLVMEYVRGLDLEQQARRRAFGPAESAVLVARVARALAAAHRRGVLHRDVKPRNIILDEAGQPRLIDFGLALLEDAWRRPEERPGVVSGTLSYIPPEQARGEPATVRSDVFGLGGVLFFLLTGRPPYPGSGFYEVLARAGVGEWDREALAGAHVPPRLRSIVERALAPESAHRFASAEEMAAALESVARPPRRRPWLAAAGAALLLMLAGVALWAAWGRGNAHPSTDAAVPVAAAPRKFELIVMVGRGQGDGYKDLTDCAPLVNGDKVRIESVAPAGMHAALFHLTSAGQLRLLTAVQPADEDRRLSYPDEDPKQAKEVVGATGDELVLMAARRSAPVTADDLRDLLVGPWAALPAGLVLRLTPDEVKRAVPGREFGPTREHADPEGEVRHRLDEVRQQMRRRHFDHFEALMFVHRQ